MSPNRNYQDFASLAATRHIGRKLLCAFIASALTVVLLGEVGKSVAQAAQGAAAEQGISDRAML